MLLSLLCRFTLRSFTLCLSLLSIMLIVNCSTGFSQSKKPVAVFPEEHPVLYEEVSVSHYDIAPDERLRVEEEPKTYYAETKTIFEMEAADSAFILGKKTAIEGFRMANIDYDGQFILMEDNVDPVIYLRFQKLATTQVEIRIYGETGELVFSRKERYLPLGIEMPVNHAEWKAGKYCLQIKADQGKVWKKTIVKNDAVVMR
ncbi:MAG: hypothetical protein SF052_06230 [Bacteroidia bacterium]|nr:hypothetical protein [Bacteroidia bacterium]